MQLQLGGNSASRYCGPRRHKHAQLIFEATPFARLLYKLEHFQRQAHNTGHAATLNTENQRLLFTRAHENDHSLPKA